VDVWQMLVVAWRRGGGSAGGQAYPDRNYGARHFGTIRGIGFQPVQAD